MLSTYVRTGDPEARAWLAREKENLLAVVRRFRAPEAVRALEPVMLERAPPERLQLFDHAIERAADPELRASLLTARGRLLGIRGLAEAAIADFEAAVELARTAGARAVEAEALLLLGVRMRQRGRYEEGLALTERALAQIEGTEHPRIEAQVHACHGLLLGELGRTGPARIADERALVMFRALGDRGSEGLALGNLAQLAQADGDHRTAERLYREAVAAFETTQDVAFEGMYLGYHAGLAHERGDHALAFELYRTSLARLAHADVRHVGALILGGAAALDADCDWLDEAERRFAEARHRLEGSGVPGFESAIDLHLGLLDLARARTSGAHGHLVAARARLADPRASASGFAVRFARRLLTAALARTHAGTPALTVGPTWFFVRGATEVDLARRGPIRRVLLALVEQHRTSGGALDREALLGAGWPGEQVQAEAASTRVRVAIATLRRLGLERIIVTRDDGYLIDPDLTIALETATSLPVDRELVDRTSDRIRGARVDEPEAVEG